MLKLFLADCLIKISYLSWAMYTANVLYKLDKLPLIIIESLERYPSCKPSKSLTESIVD